MSKIWDLKKKKWFYVALWVSCVYSTLYIVRPICEFLKEKLPFDLSINLLLGLLFICLAFLFYKKKITRPSSYILFVLTLIFYIYFFSKIEYPEEKIHFAEYGFLAYLIYNALRIDMKKGLAFLGAFLLTSGFGWGDEGIQYLLPNRYYQMSDVLLNSLSGFLGLVLTYIFESPSPHRMWSSTSGVGMR